MGHYVLTNAKCLMDGLDLSGDLNAAALAFEAELQDDTTFGHGTRVRKGGLKTVGLDLEGYFNGGVGAIDDVLFGRIGLADVPVSIGPENGVEGETGYAFLAALAEYNPGAEIGSMLAFSASAEAAGSPLVRGTILVNRTATATGNSGTALQLGAVAAGQRLYAALHVVAASGTTPTLDVTVRSDNAVGFGSPTTQLTFAQASVVGSQWLSAPGPIADDHWRVDFTIGGGGPSFTFFVLVGIL